ncbi:MULTISPECIES: hypothetical protein [unclassified Methylobacterium]|nr:MULTISPECIES: hypothetical protein [unclassified Methylobacterium]
MKSLRLLVLVASALGLQACSSTGGTGSPESTQIFLKDEMGRRGL